MGHETTLVSRAATAMWLKRHPGITLAHPEREMPHIELRMRDVPRLAVDKAKSGRFRRRNKSDVPWITPEAIERLSTLLRPTDHGLEFGAGGSTIWLARRCATVRSVDGFAFWHDQLAARIERERIANITLTLVSADELGYESAAHRDAYVNVYPELEPGSLDWVFVDGEYRDQTAARGIDLLKPGGLLVLDDANSFVPSGTRSTWKVTRPASPLWAEVMEKISDWRVIWTTNGVSDTAIWTKR